jgi:hypothetical protein
MKSSASLLGQRCLAGFDEVGESSTTLGAKQHTLFLRPLGGGPDNNKHHILC